MAESEEKKKGGAPSMYSEELADQICEAISTSSKGLYRICQEREDFPNAQTVYAWIIKYPEFANKYARARDAQADYMASEILDIADDGKNDTMVDDQGRQIENREWTSRSKLRVEARKWLASKLAPKKYGDKLDIDHTTGGQPITGMKIT